MKRFISLRTKVIAINLCIVIIPMTIIGCCLYNKAIDIMKQKQNVYAMNSLNNMMIGIENVTDYTKELSLMLIQNKEVREFLRVDSTNVEEYTKKNISLHYLLMFYAGKREYVDSIYIRGDNGVEFTSEADMSTYISLEMLEEMDRKKGGLVWSDEDGMISICRNIMDINNPGKKLGLLKINISMEAIKKLFDTHLMKYSESIALINSKGEVILASGEDHQAEYLKIIGASTINEGTYEDAYQISYIKRMPKSDWKLLITVRLSDLIMEMHSIKLLLWMSILISFILCIALTVLFSRYILEPLKQLAEKIGEIHADNYKVQLNFKSNDEIGIISQSFNNMTSRLDELINEILLGQVRQKELEIKALQTQIDPHCLYNNFDTAYWMSRLEKADKTSRILLALSDLYKINLSTHTGVISVQKEIEHLESYFTIQEIRTNGSISMHIEVEAEIERLKTMCFVLQPLVENSIQHGILPYSVEGKIIIRIYVQDNILYFVIEDNGQGANLEELYTLLEGTEHQTRKGLAIRNIDKRIKLKFGNTYGLTFALNKQGGLRATITQPIFTE